MRIHGSCQANFLYFGDVHFEFWLELIMMTDTVESTNQSNEDHTEEVKNADKLRAQFHIPEHERIVHINVSRNI